MPTTTKLHSAMNNNNITEKPYPSPQYANYVLGVLLVAYIFSFLDRQILGLMVGPVKESLDISDFEFSLLTGPAFALFYAFMGIPIGRLADLKNRKVIITVGVAVWSLMTCLSGLAKTYTLLFLARVGVGVGEAALSPPAYSLMSDYFPPEKQARAMAIYTMGVTLGIGLAGIIGGALYGWIDDLGELVLPLVGAVESWQLTFFAVGIPGAAIVLLMMTIKEPPRRDVVVTAASTALESIPFSQVIAYLWSKRKAYSAVIFSIPLVGITGYAYMVWYPEFLLRTYDVERGTHGIISGSLYLVFGTLSTLLGAALANYLRRKGYADANVRLLMLVTVALPIPAFLGPLMPTLGLALLLGVPTIMLQNCYFGVAMAGLASITPNRMRAQLIAFILLLANITGLGFGTTFVASFTDFVFHDDNMLNYSLAIVSGLFASAAALVAWRGLPHYTAELARVTREQAS